jgi:ABC-type amino acid transport substrate-binding protein
MIGPVVSWHNVYYNRIGQPFIWDEDQIRHQRIGVIKGSFSQFYLQQRYASEITLVTFGTIEQLISGIEDDRVDYILGDLSSLESALRGNELFRGVLKVAGITRSELQMGHGPIVRIHCIICSRRFTGCQVTAHCPKGLMSPHISPD